MLWGILRDRIEKLFGRKGSAAVLLCIMLFSVTSMICVTYEAAERKTAVSVAESAFESAGRSILACYDQELQSRYDLFGFEIGEQKVESMIRKMVFTSLNKTKIGNCTVSDIQVEAGAFSLADPEIFMDQLREIGRRSLVTDALSCAKKGLSKADSSLSKGKSIEGKVEEAGNAKAPENDEADPEATARSEQEFKRVKRDMNKIRDISSSEPVPSSGDRTLNNGRITSALPSVSAGYGNAGAYSGGSVIRDLSEEGIGKTAGDELYLLSYLNGHFQNKVDKDVEGDHFFNNEVEYILFGKKSDTANYRKTYQAIFAIREASNIAFLYSDSVKRDETMAAAEALTPGPFAPATQLLIIAAWAALESWNDMANLENGNGVPLVKSNSTWMTTISMVVNYSGQKYLVIPGDSEMTYGKYLDILLMTVDRKTKVYRIMDLIQINMKGAVREDFLLADHFTGFSVKGEIRKNSHASSVPGSKAVISMTHAYWTEGS